ncbi:unnamed protein product, partial [Mesorhabditis spiculigera]
MRGYRPLFGHFRWTAARRRVGATLAVVFLLLLVFLETWTGCGYGLYMGYYRLSVTVQPPPITPGVHHIQLVVVVKNGDMTQYALAQQTMRCYAQMHNYTLHTIRLDEEAELAAKCGPHQDFMFLRHCLLAYKMEEWPTDEWILFLDADIGVVNPAHRVEEYLPSSNSTWLRFYSRIMNHELMAGSYLIRNNAKARKFLRFWADYEKRLPASFHGSDNGAIHAVIPEWSHPNLTDQRANCRHLWEISSDFSTLSDFTVCSRALMAKYPPQGIDLLPKGRHSWSRDGWLTSNMWSEVDFMFHGWQLRRQGPRGFAAWYPPIVSDGREWPPCTAATGHLHWRYKDTFIKSRLQTDRLIEKVISSQHQEYNTRLSRLTLQNFIAP